MDEQDRRENAERIRRQLDEGLAPEAIFPTVKREARPELILPPPKPVATFVAADIPSPHGGTSMRHYVVDCQHANSELDLMGYTRDRDPEVLGNMMFTHWRRSGCSCMPEGWAAA